MSGRWRAFCGGRPAAAATALLALLLLGLFPLYCGWRGYAAITAAKRSLFLLLCAGYALALLAVWLRAPRRLCRPVFPWAERLLLLFFLAACVSLLLSAHRPALTADSGLLLLALYIGLALAVGCFGRWHAAYLYAAALALLLCSLLALAQLLGANPLSLYPAGYGYADGGVRYVGWFLGTVGNIDLLSSYQCLTLPLLFFGAPQLPRPGRAFVWLAAGLGLLVLVWMHVSAGILAVTLTACLLLPLCLPRGWRRAVYFALALLFVLALLLVYAYDGAEAGTVWELSRLLHGDIRDSFGSSRILIWRDALDGLSRGELLLGSGPGTRAAHFSTVFTRESEAGVVLTARVSNAHSEYLDLLLENGLLGLTLYLAALAAAARRALPALAGDATARALGGSLLCYLLHAFFHSAEVLVAPLFWLLLGLLLAHTRLRKACGHDKIAAQAEIFDRA